MTTASVTTPSRHRQTQAHTGTHRHTQADTTATRVMYLSAVGRNRLAAPAREITFFLETERTRERGQEDERTREKKKGEKRKRGKEGKRDRRKEEEGEKKGVGSVFDARNGASTVRGTTHIHRDTDTQAHRRMDTQTDR